VIYGAEAKLELPDWRRLSGFVSYSYTVGQAWYPVTGGLFLGADAQEYASGHFPDSQDQRNTVRGRLRYQVVPASGSRAEFNMTLVCRSSSMAILPRCWRSMASRFWIELTSPADGSILPSRSTPPPVPKFTSQITSRCASRSMARISQMFGRHRFRRSVLGQRYRPLPERRNALNHQLLA